MLKIFISYRREDSAGHTGRMCDHLAEHFTEGDIYRDLDSIKPGEDFVTAIHEAIASCGVLLAVIGRRWANSVDASGRLRLDDPDDLVRAEIAWAFKMG